ncbi:MULTISPECIES: preprotein translocase subunit SecG [Deferrisoma]
MYTALIILHVLVSFILVGIVLLQQGKGADMGAVFGGSSQTLFGSSGGTTFLGKLTAAAAGVFMLTSLGLTYMASHRYKVSVVPDQPAATAPAPEAPAPAEQPAQQPAGQQ